MNKKISVLTIGILLGGCGGGGGGGDPAPAASTSSFPAAQAMANFVTRADTVNASISGTLGGTNVTGTGTIAYSAAVGDTFEGQAVLSKTVTVNGTASDGATSIPFASTATSYFTTDYEQVGSFSTGVYCVLVSPASYPSSVKIGDTGKLGTAECYSDSSKTTQIGSTDLSFLIEKDSASTAILDLIENTNNLSNSLVSSIQIRYRLDTSGNLSFASEDLTDNSTTPVSVLHFTFN